MKLRRHALIGYLALVVALMAWASVNLGAWRLITIAGEHAADEARVRQSAADATYAARLNALANDTRADRDTLNVLTKVDIVSIVDMLDSTGKSAGVDVQVSDVTPDTAHPPSKTEPLIQSVSFTLQAHGKFSALMRLLALLESLPLPSVMQGLDMSRDPSAQAGAPSMQWHMHARIQVYTSADISS